MVHAFKKSALRSVRAAVLVFVLSPLAGGCDILSSTGNTDIDIAAALAPIPLPPASDFVSAVTNTFFPLAPGTVFRYRQDTDDGVETVVVTVTTQAKTILGIQATVVHDQEFLDDELIEDTFDWFAQDKSGNVWYLGEATCEIENGVCVSTEGSWEAGVNGALAGIIMWGDPAAHQGENYRQEFFEGEAEDIGKVLKTGLSVSVPAGDFTNCVETMDWTPLEPGVREHKYYCAGIGLVLETHKKERSELISVSH
jgi:hypothetical protein